MTSAEPLTGPLLEMLERELGARGVTCTLQPVPQRLRLAVHCPGVPAGGDDPLDAVVVHRLGGAWWYGWPQVVPVGPAAFPDVAAGAIVAELGLGQASAGLTPLRDLAVRRRLRQARLTLPGGDAPSVAGWPLASVQPRPGGGAR